MIIIFSNKDDISTSKVMDYLFLWGENVVRINREDALKVSYTTSLSRQGNTRLKFFINEQIFEATSIKSIWFRRGGLCFKGINETQLKKDQQRLKSLLNDYLTLEQETLNAFIYEILLSSTIRVLGNPFLMDTKKLSVLKRATEFGLEVPETLITTERKTLKYFMDSNGGTVITKAIQDNFTPITSTSGYGCLTEMIDNNLLNDMPENFFPSLFQQKIDKKFDIRIFYLDGEFFSVAILSQKSENTQVDFRNYDFKNPNRKVLFNLPGEVKIKLSKLLKFFRLNTASIDMVYSNDNRYVFLEINPVGQYDMVGSLMNLKLDKKIALWLAKS